MKRLVAMICLLLVAGQVMAGCNNAIIASTATADFTINGDGTVTHKKTGLMWKRCSEGLSGNDCAIGTITRHSWQEALQLVKTINSNGGFAGYTDWRLPNVKELASIVERKCVSPAINTTIFPATADGYYWSASSYADHPTRAWHVYFGDGNNDNFSKDLKLHVRLVRGGQ